jgi:hypothetical protein
MPSTNSSPNGLRHEVRAVGATRGSLPGFEETAGTPGATKLQPDCRHLDGRPVAPKHLEAHLAQHNAARQKDSHEDALLCCDGASGDSRGLRWRQRELARDSKRLLDRVRWRRHGDWGRW